MKKLEILNENGEIANMELIFAFTCQENTKNYVAVHNKNSIFEPNSRYVNIDIFEIVQTKSKYIYVSDIPDEDWPAVKKALQFTVFAKMN